MSAQARKTLGEILRTARIDKDIGLRDLSRQLEKSPSYVSDIENDRRIPSEAVLIDFARVLELDFEQLMAIAGRLGSETEDLVERSPEAVSLFRKISGLGPADFRKVADQVDRIDKRDRKR